MSSSTMKYLVLCCGLLCTARFFGAAAHGTCGPSYEMFQTFMNGFCRQDRPRTCADVKSNQTRQVAVLESGLEVLCDMETDGGGWIVIQRRANSDVDFYRTWKEYKYGFGDLEGNFWFGNEKISRLTQLRRYELRVDIIFHNVSYYAVYDHFDVTGEDDNYRLRLGSYSGNSSDGLGYHNNRPFTTHDRDNDEYGTNCAVAFHGAWWYGSCHNSNLNGLWGSKAYGKGLTWDATTGDYDTPSFSEMKIRAVAS